jgi:hypothetical protein
VKATRAIIALLFVAASATAIIFMPLPRACASETTIPQSLLRIVQMIQRVPRTRNNQLQEKEDYDKLPDNLHAA